jgi:hypothetical protein
VTVVAIEVVGCEERKKRYDWYDEECQINVEESNVQVKMVNRKTRLSTENYKNQPRKPRKSVKGDKRAYECKVVEGMEETNKRNDARKFYIIADGLKPGVLAKNAHLLRQEE